MTMLAMDMMLVSAASPSFKAISKLFAGGADGMLIDLTNKTTLFQDANGIASVINHGDRVGMALDQRKWGGLSLAEYRAAQPELVANGRFTTDLAGWTKGPSYGTMSWQAPGKIRLVPTNSSTPSASAPIACVVGRWYEVTVETVTGNGNYTGFGIGTAPTTVATYTTGNMGSVTGVFRRFFKATATTHYVVLYGPGSSGLAEFDNISVKEIDGRHAMQTGSLRPTWDAAGGDVYFSGTAYLTTDFYFHALGNFAAVYHRGLGATSSDRFALGMRVSAASSMHIGQWGAAGRSVVGSGNWIATGQALGSGEGTIIADATDGVNVSLFRNGILENTIGGQHSWPVAAGGRAAFIGARNNLGSPEYHVAGNLRRVVCGQLQLRGTMDAEDFHRNLMAA